MGFNTQNLQARTVSLGNEILQMFGLKTIGGWRASDPYPDHPSGWALDLMTNDIGSPSLKNPKGDAIANYLIANSARLGVKYIIWNGQSWNPERGTWAKYTGSNPHTDHVHVTLKSTPGTGGAPITSGDINNVAYKPTGLGLTDKLFDIDGFIGKVQGTTMTLGAALFGIALVGTGVVLAVRPSITKKLGG